MHTFPPSLSLALIIIGTYILLGAVDWADESDEYSLGISLDWMMNVFVGLMGLAMMAIGCTQLFEYLGHIQ